MGWIGAIGGMLISNIKINLFCRGGVFYESLGLNTFLDMFKHSHMKSRVEGFAGCGKRKQVDAMVHYVMETTN